MGDYDIICNLSSLESFSNNFIEAWASKRILLCVKEEWSVFEANEAALYLDLADIKNSVLEIDDFLSSEISIKKYLQLTNKKLKMYNNYTSKYHEYLKIIKNA